MNSLLMNRLTKPDFMASNVDTLADKTLSGIQKSRWPLLLWTSSDPNKPARAIPIRDNIIFEGLKIGEHYREVKPAPKTAPAEA